MRHENSKWPAATETCPLQRWDEFEKYLAGSIHRLREKEDRFLVITSGSNRRYVRFRSLSPGYVEGEAVSNHFLMGAGRLMPAACLRLTRLGWRNSSIRGPANKNYLCQWSPAASSEEIALLAEKTLREAFGAISPADLEIHFDAFGARAPALSPVMGVADGIFGGLNIRGYGSTIPFPSTTVM